METTSTTSTTSVTLPIYRVDATSLKVSDCLLRWFRQVVVGYREIELYNDTLYGNGYHAFTKVLYETNGDVGKALFEALETFKRHTHVRPNKGHLNEQHLTKTCVEWFDKFKKDERFQVLSVDGKPMVEVEFDIPFVKTSYYEIRITGTIDKFGKFDSGCYAIGDYKTHSLWSVSKNGTAKMDAEIKAFFNKFEISLQLRMYLWALKRLAKMYPDTELAKIVTSSRIGLFIDGIFLSGTSMSEFRRSDVFYTTDEEMEEFELLLTNKVGQLVTLLDKLHTSGEIYQIRDGIISGACVDKTFACPFIPACNAKRPEVRDLVLKNNFRVRQYNPLLFGKE